MTKALRDAIFSRPWKACKFKLDSLYLSHLLTFLFNSQCWQSSQLLTKARLQTTKTYPGEMIWLTFKSLRPPMKQVHWTKSVLFIRLKHLTKSDQLRWLTDRQKSEVKVRQLVAKAVPEEYNRWMLSQKPIIFPKVTTCRTQTNIKTNKL